MREAVVNRFLHWFAVGLMSPVFVLMIMSKGIALSQAGVAVAAMSATVVVVELPSGILADAVGRKRTYLFALALALAALGLLYFAQGLAAVALALAVYGASRAVSSGSIEAAFIDRHIEREGRERLAPLMSAMNAAEAAGLALGALVGGWVPAAWRAVAPGSNPYGGTILMQAAVLAALLFMTAASPTGRKTGSAGPSGASGAAAPAAAGERRPAPLGFVREAAALIGREPSVAALLIGAAAWGLAFGSVELFWQPRFRAIIGGPDAGEAALGALNAAYFGAAIAGSVLMGRLLSGPLARVLPRSKPLAAAAAGRALTAGVLIALAPQAGSWGFAAAFTCLMLANGMGGVAEATAFNERIPGERRASFMSLSSLVLQLGGVASSLAFGAAAAYVPVGALWLVAAGALAASAALYAGVQVGKAAA